MQYKMDDIPDKPLQNMQILNELSDNAEKDKKLTRPPSSSIQSYTPKSKKVEKEIRDISGSMVINEYRQSLEVKPREDKRFSEILLKSQEKLNLNDINQMNSQSISTGPSTTRRTKNNLDDIRRIYDAKGLSPNSSFQTLLNKNPKETKERVLSAS